MELELDRIKVFDVLKNSLNGELSLVMSVSGDRLDLRDKTGSIARYKFGKHFSLAAHDTAVEFRALVRAVREQQKQSSGKKKRPRTASSFLNKLAKKKR